MLNPQRPPQRAQNLPPCGHAACGSASQRILVSLEGCPRCGQPHPAIVSTPFHGKPSGPYTHWSICPNTGDPVLLRADAAMKNLAEAFTRFDEAACSDKDVEAPVELISMWIQYTKQRPGVLQVEACPISPSFLPKQVYRLHVQFDPDSDYGKRMLAICTRMSAAAKAQGVAVEDVRKSPVEHHGLNGKARPDTIGARAPIHEPTHNAAATAEATAEAKESAGNGEEEAPPAI